NDRGAFLARSIFTLYAQESSTINVYSALLPLTAPRHARHPGTPWRGQAAARDGESHGERDSRGSGAAADGPASVPGDGIIVETFRRAEIKHAERRKSFHAMRNFHVNVARVARAHA